MDILLNHWRVANSEHLERERPKGKPDEANILPEI
jgi:hypothetical protein